MALDIDGFAVLRVIADHASTFAGVEAEVNKQARALVVKQVSSKATDLSKLREISVALGADGFAPIAEGLPDAKIKTLVTKFDKYNPGVESEGAAWRRRRLGELASGSSEPVEKAAAPKKAAGAKKPARGTGDGRRAEESEFLEFRSAGARRKR